MLPAAGRLRCAGRAGADPADRAPEAQPGLARLTPAGQLTVPVWRSYPLAEAAAHSGLEAGRNHGKIVLLP
jgi:NADPH:quinone reductase-like Zn-dependent oxidoreductase